MTQKPETTPTGGACTLVLDRGDATEIYNAFRGRGPSHLKNKVAAALIAFDAAEGREPSRFDWYNPIYTEDGFAGYTYGVC